MDRVIKATNPWNKYFVLNSGAPKADDLDIARTETMQQIKQLKLQKRPISKTLR